MKKIVRGNDITLRIPVKKMVDGELRAFSLPACTDVTVTLSTIYRKYPLEYYVDAAEDHVIVAKVEGEKMPLGKMALEVKGKIYDLDWRSKEYEQIEFVDNNASGDTSFDGSTDEGEESVEMDTAVVVLPPTADLSLLIKTTEELQATVKANEEARQTAEAKRDADTQAAIERAKVSADYNPTEGTIEITTNE